VSQIAFIDTGISDYQNLIVSIPQDFEVYLLDAQMDGVLASQDDVSAILVFSRGSSGAVQLGSMTLT
jgi:hypothetical protein